MPNWATPLVWPRVLAPSSVLLSLDARSRSAGVSLSGIEQVIGSVSRLWRVSLSFPALDRDRLRLWHAIGGRLDGRLGTIMVPSGEADRAPWPILDGVRQVGSSRIPHGDGSLHADGAGYAQDGIHVNAAADAAANQPYVAVAITVAGAIEPGQHFSVAGRLYRIVSSYVPQGQTTATLQVTPPLRAPIPAGTRLQFDWPTVLCRLASDTGMDRNLQMLRFGGASVEFVEAF